MYVAGDLASRCITTTNAKWAACKSVTGTLACSSVTGFPDDPGQPITAVIEDGTVATESEGVHEAKGGDDDVESRAAPAPPAEATLLKACYHRGVTMEALQARGSEAAAKEKDSVRATLAAPGARPRDA